MAIGTKIYNLKFKIAMAARTDVFRSPDYYLVDELFTEEQKLIRESVRNYVKKEISPIIEDYAQRAEFPQQIVKQLGDLGCFGPTVPVEYGGGGLTLTEASVVLRYLASGRVAMKLAAVLDDMNAAVRAFCNDTSVPNSGASRVRAMPRISP